MIAGRSRRFQNTHQISPDDWVGLLQSRYEDYKQSPIPPSRLLTTPNILRPEEKNKFNHLSLVAGSKLQSPVKFVDNINNGRWVGRYVWDESGSPVEIQLANSSRGKSLQDSLFQFRTLAHEMGHSYYRQNPSQFKGLGYDSIFGDVNPYSDELMAEALGYGIVNKVLPKRAPVILPHSARVVERVPRYFGDTGGLALMEYEELMQNRPLLANRQQLDDAVKDIVHSSNVAPMMNRISSSQRYAADWR